MQPDKLYFLSRPVYNTVEYSSTNPINIFTTKTIRKFLTNGVNVSSRRTMCSGWICCKLSSLQKIPARFIIAFNDIKMTLDKRAIRIHTIHTDSICGNVMYIFEYTGNWDQYRTKIQCHEFNDFSSQTNQMKWHCIPADTMRTGIYLEIFISERPGKTIRSPMSTLTSHWRRLLHRTRL